MLGNLLDNACKWPRRDLAVSRIDGDRVELRSRTTAGDCGKLRTAMLRRGGRADEASPGSGLGLSIVGDLAEVYGARSHWGRLPRVACA
jgi:signal transduction histidine kinase